MKDSCFWDSLCYQVSVCHHRHRRDISDHKGPAWFPVAISCLIRRIAEMDCCCCSYPTSGWEASRHLIFFISEGYHRVKIICRKNNSQYVVDTDWKILTFPSFVVKQAIHSCASMTKKEGKKNTYTHTRSKQINFLFQDWLALSPGVAQLTLQGKLQFENGGAPLEQDNFAFCKVIIILVWIFLWSVA